MKKQFYTFIFCFVACVCSLHAEKYFVTETGLDGNDGLTWATAKSLNAALTDVALADGDIIYVKKGTYTAPTNASFTCTAAAVSVYGNCEGTEDEATIVPPAYGFSDLETDIQTYLKGNGKRVLYFNKASTFAGFNISEGDASSSTESGSTAGRAGGVYINNAGGKLAYSVVHNNIGAGTSVTTVSGVGGGVYTIGTVEYCIIRDNVGTANTSSKRGVAGGIRVDGGYLINSIVKNNKCVSTDNTSAGSNVGGGVSFTPGGYVVNCLIEGNSTGGSENNQNYGGGIDVTLAESAAKPAVIINSTIVGNTSTGYGGGIGFKSSSSMTMQNCIVLNNMARSTQSATNNVCATSTTATITYSLWPEATTGTADNNLNADPLFVTGSYALQSGSPAATTGNVAAISGYTVDLAGNSRTTTNGTTTVSMGAYEYPGGGTGINVIDADNEDVLSVEYYTLNGVKVQQPVDAGVYIVKTTYASQKIKVTKQVFIR